MSSSIPVASRVSSALLGGKSTCFLKKYSKKSVAAYERACIRNAKRFSGIQWKACEERRKKRERLNTAESQAHSGRDNYFSLKIVKIEKQKTFVDKYVVDCGIVKTVIGKFNKIFAESYVYSDFNPLYSPTGLCELLAPHILKAYMVKYGKCPCRKQLYNYMREIKKLLTTKDTYQFYKDKNGRGRPWLVKLKSKKIEFSSWILHRQRRRREADFEKECNRRVREYQTSPLKKKAVETDFGVRTMSDITCSFKSKEEPINLKDLVSSMSHVELVEEVCGPEISVHKQGLCNKYNHLNFSLVKESHCRDFKEEEKQPETGDTDCFSPPESFEIEETDQSPQSEQTEKERWNAKMEREMEIYYAAKAEWWRKKGIPEDFIEKYLRSLWFPSTYKGIPLF
jgi:hypothetical protein